MAVKKGKLIFAEADWPATIGYKWGVLKIGSGAAVARDANHSSHGGSGAVKITTGNLSGDLAEIKTTIPYYMGNGKIAFEMKFIPAAEFGANKFDFGIEPRIVSAGFLQGRMRYEISSDEWKYESGIDTYSSFPTPLIIHQPSGDTALQQGGDQYGWARLVIDIRSKEYVSFEAAGKGKIEFRDMSGIPLVNRGSTLDDILLFFTLGITGANSNQEFFTTDWVASDLE